MSQITFGMGRDPEVVGPHDAAYLMCLFPSTSSRTPMFSCPRFLYTGSELRGHHLAQSGASPVPHCHVWTWELSLLVIPTLQTFFTILLHLTSPRHVFASVNIHISPRRLICIMNPIFRAIFGLSLTVHGEAFVLDVIWDSGDVAHVVVTTTLQALDCLWLEKMLHTHA